MASILKWKKAVFSTNFLCESHLKRACILSRNIGTSSYSEKIALAAREDDIVSLKNIFNEQVERTGFNFVNGLVTLDGWKKGASALHYAAFNNSKGAIKILKENGGDILCREERFNGTPLHFASENGNYDASFEILDGLDDSLLHDALISKDKFDRIPLHLAAFSGHENIIRLLLGFNEESILELDKSGHTPLMCSAIKGHDKCYKLMSRSKFGVDASQIPNIHGLFPLHAAAIHGSNAIIEEIISLLSESLESMTFLEWSSKGGWTALLCAAHWGHFDAAASLIYAGASPECRDTLGNTPLHVSSAENHSDLIEFFQSVAPHTRLLENSNGDIPAVLIPKDRS